MEISEVVDARKERIDASAAWNLLKNAVKITAAKGKKSTEWNPQQDSKEDILKQVMGPSGNLRAPACRVGDEFVVGFNIDVYRQWLQEK